MLDTRAFYNNLLTVDEIVAKILGGFENTSILNLYAFSDIQLECLRNAIIQIIENLHVPLNEELGLKDGFSAKKLTVGTLNILGYSIQLLNTHRTFGVDTNLEIKIPIEMIYNLYVKNLCEYYQVSNDMLGKKSIKSHLNKPNKSQMQLFFKSLSQTNLLVSSQRCSSQINNHLLFSLNTTFLP